MMNNQMNELIKAMGITVELWIMTYKNFKSRGFDDKEAMRHTTGFMEAFLGATLKSNKENPDDSTAS